MAIANLNTNKVKGSLNTINTGTFTAFDATAGAEYTASNADNETVVVLNNTAEAAKTVVLKAPTNPAIGVGTSGKDVSVSLAAGAIGVLMVETMKYMDANGKVTLTGPADVKALVVEM